MGAETGGTGDMSPPPTLKSRGTSYVLFPPTFTTTFILIGWLVGTYKIVPAPLPIHRGGEEVYSE